MDTACARSSHHEWKWITLWWVPWLCSQAGSRYAPQVGLLPGLWHAVRQQLVPHWTDGEERDSEVSTRAAGLHSNEKFKWATRSQAMLNTPFQLKTLNKGHFKKSNPFFINAQTSQDLQLWGPQEAQGSRCLPVLANKLLPVKWWHVTPQESREAGRWQRQRVICSRKEPSDSSTSHDNLTMHLPRTCSQRFKYIIRFYFRHNINFSKLSNV